ncbi:aminotransferase class V-fold PLP-dependent enzyme [Jatrophihabitans sp.]|uniref:aminotransferase class V-fold PLP-dependent enzyme n=1 Tax=Jatrophihabitans sp. TaxID=1932789 RepID=UPI0030C67CC7|nr:Cysteine desulfurase family protein family [Jatrophihabitans sp.]
MSNVVASSNFDVGRVRGLYPALGSGPAPLDGPFGAIQPESVIRAVIATLRGSPAQPGAHSSRSRSSATVVRHARQALADLVGSEPSGVYFGGTLAALNAQFADIVSWGWRLGDEVALSRLDASSVSDPWQRAARMVGAGVRWSEVDLETGELPIWQYDQLINPNTRLVSVPLANPALGFVPDIRSISEVAHENGALVYVDAGAAVPHLTIDLPSLGADIVGLNTASFGGPTVAALITRPGLLAEINATSIRPPRSAEVGPLPIELLAGATAAVDHLAGLDQRAVGTRRQRLTASITAARRHTSALLDYLEQGLQHQPHVTVLGSLTDRVPVLAFTVARHTPDQVAEALERNGVSVWTGPTDVEALLESFGADEHGGATFVGLMPHTTAAEIDLLLDGLFTLRAAPRR